MGFYAAALAFTPAGHPVGPRLEGGADVTYLPSLSQEDRQTTFAGSRVENTNLTSVLPRPRLRWRPAERWLLEAGFFPPTRVFGVTPEQYAAAVAWRAGEAKGRVGFSARAHYLRADIEGPITCSVDEVEDPANTVCYLGQVSADHFRPTAFGLEWLVDGRRIFAEGLAWYAGVGWEHQTLRFATHFVNAFGRLDDQRLVARVERTSIVGGITWTERHGLRLSFEGSYVPDALATARVGICWGWGRP